MSWLGGLAALSGAMAVAAGAFGAHRATGDAAMWLRTGAEYQMVHAVAALVALGWAGGRGPALLFLLGGLVFGSTLYAMALGAPRILGAVTPIGGTLLIAGWIWAAVVLFRAT
jgi:uncharacterized membrane protein YgdD (TMEM256/DUF423 family)